MMKLILASAALLAVAACTPGDIATVRTLTIDDGARYVQENHDRRRDIRKQLYALEDEVISKCVDRARSLEITGDVEESISTLEQCFDFLDGAYPSLATIEALREGRAALDSLRKAGE